MKRFFLSLLASLLIAFGCKDSKEPVTPTIDPLADFRIEVYDVTTTSVRFRITPNDTQMRYVAMMTPKSYFDSFGSDDEYINDDLLWFEEKMYDEGISAEEFYSRELKQGVMEDTQGDLTPETSYYVYAYGMNLNGLVITPLYKMEFTTKSVDIEELNFQIEVSEVDYSSALITVTPDRDDAYYFVNAFSEEEYQEWGGDAQAFANQLIALRDYYFAKGATVEQMVANLGFVGKKSLRVDDLKAGVKYYAYAIGINADFLACSHATADVFYTLSAEQVDLSFDVDIRDVKYDRISGSVTPSSDEHSYICAVQSANVKDWYRTDEEFMDAIISDIKYWQGGVDKALRRGAISLDNIGGIAPASDYLLVCFGFDGAVTTPLYTYPFSTPIAEGDPQTLTIELSISNITYNSVNVTTDPSEGVYYFASYVESQSFDAAVRRLGTEDRAIAHFANADIDYGAEFFYCSRAEYLSDVGATLGRYTHLFNQLTPDTEYIAFAIAVDISTGELASERGFLSEPFTTAQKIVSTAKVEFLFGNYYDGTELAELDPSKYLRCKGLVVLPYTIKVNDEAAKWYTGFFAGDYTEWGCTDDDIYAELVKYGYNFDSEQVSLNSEGGVAVLSYDTAFSFLGIAEDANGNFGLGTLEVVTLSRDGVSPAEEFLQRQ